MNIETSKNLGGVGAILVFLGILPIFAYSGTISLVGLVLLLVSAKGFADNFHESGIFNNALYAVIVTIAGGLVTVAVALSALVSFLAELGLDLVAIQDWQALSAIDWQAVGLDAIMRFFGSIVLVVVVIWVFGILAAFFVRKALGLLGRKTGVSLFSTAGILILVGAFIPVLGLLLIWVALLLLAVAFFSVKSGTLPSPVQV